MKKENQFTCLFLGLFVRIEFSIHYNLNALNKTDTQEKNSGL